MMRSPYSAPGRSADGSSGGFATEIETDVMRFMAILALCLVAIFALVQSLPEAPSPVVAAAEVSAGRAPVAATKPDAAAARPMTREPTEARPAREPTAPAASFEPAPAEATQADRAPIEVAATEVEPVAVADEGLILQFESDHALARLVERDAVGLYAFSADSTHRLRAASGRMSFHHASVPEAFHEMDAATVPVQVRRALAAAGVTEAPVQWGVTLPAATSAELERLLRVAQGGTLIIDARGELRLER